MTKEKLYVKLYNLIFRYKEIFVGKTGYILHVFSVFDKILFHFLSFLNDKKIINSVEYSIFAKQYVITTYLHDDSLG